MSKLKKVVSIILVFAMLVGVGINSNTQPINAATTITDNYTMATAYNMGTWSSFNTAGNTAVMAADATESWFKFTVAAGNHIYIRVSSNTAYEGMSIQLKNSLGVDVGGDKSNPDDLMDIVAVSGSLYLDCDNTGSSTETYYLVVSRGAYDASAAMYFGFTAYDRIRNGQGTFSFSGKASNAGNPISSYNPNGVDSTELRLDLTNSTLIPNEAIVTSITTSGTQSPKQGNTHHMIRPASADDWFTSTVAASASSGSYIIALNDNFAAKQVWNFKYNAVAGAKSTMSNIKVTIKWQYDMKDTEYKIFTK